jgi:hypothetical protein
LDENSINRAIFTARAAFHTSIAVLDLYVLSVHFEDFMGTNIQAHSAASAFILIKF